MVLPAKKETLRRPTSFGAKARLFLEQPVKMNIFRLSADMLHLLSFIIMLYRMKTQRSCRGVSLKTQILFLIVFCCRYLVCPPPEPGAH